MSVIVNASTATGLGITSDNSGTVEIQSNGTTKLTVASTGVYGTVTTATAQATTSGTAIDFTGIPSWVKKITVMFNGVSANASSAMIVQIGFGSIENTGYLSGGGYSSASGTATITSTSGFIINNSNPSSTFTANFLINLISGSTYISSHSGFDAGTGNNFMVGGGSKSTTAIIDRIRITTAGGTATFDAGSINIMYEG